MRSTIHDLANLLSGIKGILDLSDPERPLRERDRVRLDAILAEGATTLERARFLAIGTLPDAALEDGAGWRRRLSEELGPLSAVFRCTFEVTYEGEAGCDHWPGELLKGYILAVSRQVLPYAQGSSLGIVLSADPREWRIRWSPAPVFPECLRPGTDERPRDISSRWALQAGNALGATLAAEENALLARIPRF
ncbi:MAG TPA: hypothetical protein PKM35_08330 [Holophaga sp.]|nr:hypothetical protein [Holophaga sp.]HPS67610.1 hypothetical protein [Holophaga sp.]